MDRTPDVGAPRAGPSRGRCARFWAHVLDLGLTVWVLRAAVVAMLLGFAILVLAPQAQDLLVDVAAGPWWYIILFLLAVFVIWAAPVHYASRLLVETDRRYRARGRRRGTCFIAWLKLWSPRILGAFAFVSMLIAVYRSWLNVPTVYAGSLTADAKLSLVLLAVYLAVALVLFVWYVVAREALAALPIVRWLERAAAMIVAPAANWLPVALRLQRHAPRPGETDSDLGPLYLALMFVLFTFIPFFFPFTFAAWFPRAIAVPFVLGGWTPLAAYASGIGRYLRVPIISFAILSVVLLTFVLGDNYAVRRIDPASSVAKLTDVPRPDLDALTRRLKLTEAIDLWKRANNNCTTDCPRPIIIAASGGASRAGFFTASVIGRLLDSAAPQADGKKLDAQGVRNRLFAISSVSGSSVGTVMTVAALATADGGTQPCRSGHSLFWRGAQVDSWQSCLEAIASGDFLTSVFAGLVFRDTLRFLGVFGKSGSFLGWSDRAALLEQSWEEHFKRLTGRQKPGASNGRPCVGSLECPFVTLSPTKVGETSNWVPLMLLNGTSVSTGQRIVTATIDPWYAPRDCPTSQDGDDPNKCAVFEDAYDFHLLLDGEQPATGILATLHGWLSLDRTASNTLFDISLSTAAHNSARFPLVSPPGEVRNRANNILDRIVDGGYFENFGAQTALELARAIQAVDSKLAPFILIVSNDPEIPIDDKLATPDANEGELLTDISGPVDATLNTRSARGTLAVDRVTMALDEMLTERCVPSVAHVRVWPEYLNGKDGLVRPLSFSWWLSKPVQQRLHEQTDREKSNEAPLRSVMTALATRPDECRGRIQSGPSSRKDPGVMMRQIR